MTPDTGAPVAVASTRSGISDRALIALLAAVCAAGPVALNIYLPALPAVSHAFAASVSDVQLTISIALLAFAGGFLLYGPLSDRFGRRPITLWSLGIFGAGTLICVLAPTLHWLIAGRIIQSLGAAGGFTVARAIVSDVYPRERMARILAYLTMIMVLGPTISPSIGGLLVTHFGWHSIFVFVLVAGVAIFIAAWRLLPETLAPALRRPLDPGFLLRSTVDIFTRRGFFLYTMQCALIYAVFLVFISIVPYVMVNGLKRPSSEYGFYYLLITFGYFLGNWMVTRLGAHRSFYQQMGTGMGIAALFACAAFALNLAGITHPLAMFLPMCVIAFGQGIALPNAMASAVGLAPEQSGMASSLVGFMQQTVGAVCVQWMSRFDVYTARPMLLFCAVTSILALLALLPVRPRASP